MLEIQHLTLTLKNELRALIEDFSLILNPGDKAVIIGEEGNGKSTLLKWIADPASIEDYAEASGKLNLHGHRLAYLPQELPHELSETPIVDYFAAQEGFWEISPPRKAALTRALGLSEDFYYQERPLSTLSGGEKVKVQMARLLLSEPDILLLDEPTGDLDLETLRWMEAFIQKAPQAILFISHDETLLENTANRVILIEQLKRKTESRWTVANVPYAVFVREREKSMAKQDQLHMSEKREEQKTMEKFRRIHDKVEHQQETISRSNPSGGRLLKKKMAAVKSLERRYEREHESMTQRSESESAILIRFHNQEPLPQGKTVLEYAAKELRAPDGRLLARDLELAVRGPEKLCIIGRNGAGKTTLLKALTEALASRRDRSFALMPQNYEDVLEPQKSALEFLVPSGRREEEIPIRNWLGSLRFTAREMDRPMEELSGGQRAKVLLLSLAVSGAQVLVMDEPTRNFSPLSGPEIRALLRAFPGAILSVSHDRKYIREVCDRVLELTPEGLREAEI